MDYIDLIPFILGFAGYFVPYKKGVKMTAGNEIVLFMKGFLRKSKPLANIPSESLKITEQILGSLGFSKQNKYLRQKKKVMVGLKVHFYSTI